MERIPMPEKIEQLEIELDAKDSRIQELEEALSKAEQIVNRDIDIRHRLTTCDKCGGYGWISGHDPTDPHIDGECTNCPVQLNCDKCESTGIVWKKDLPKPNVKEINIDI